jgi:hypothetical protein
LAVEALEEMLRSVHLTGGIFLDALFTEPWCIRGQISPEDCAPFLATPARVICFHFVVEGRALVGIAGEPPRWRRARSCCSPATIFTRLRAPPISTRSRPAR